MTKKTLFQRIWLGMKKGWNTPTLPANVISFESHPLMRIFRVIGGINVGILFWQRYHNFPSFVLYISLFIASIFFVYLIVLTIIRFKHMWKVLKNHDLDIKNSPFDRFATMFGRALFCLKGACDTAAPGATVLGLMVGFDEILKETGAGPVFIPAVASVFKVIVPGTIFMPNVTDNLGFIKNTVIPQIKLNIADSKIIEATKAMIERDGLEWGLTDLQIKELIQDCDFSAKSLEDNNKILRDQMKKCLTDYADGLLDSETKSQVSDKVKELTDKKQD